MIDLHTHSTCSDGSLLPEELVERAAREGIIALALTDHDTVAGIEDAADACRKRGILFVPGVEVEAAYPSGELHILGLNLRAPHGDLERALTEMKIERNRRNEAILDRIRSGGVAADMDEVEALAGGDVIGRPHFAALLIQKGVVSSIQEAFDRYLGRGKPYYLPRRNLHPAEVASLIRGAGGRAVVAHPLTLRLPMSELGETFRAFRSMGIDGVEAYHSNATLAQCREIEKRASSVGCFVTAGSDYHGDQRKDRRLGRTAGGMEISDEFLSAIRES